MITYTILGNFVKYPETSSSFEITSRFNVTESETRFFGDLEYGRTASNDGTTRIGADGTKSFIALGSKGNAVASWSLTRELVEEGQEEFVVKTFTCVGELEDAGGGETNYETVTGKKANVKLEYSELEGGVKILTGSSMTVERFPAKITSVDTTTITTTLLNVSTVSTGNDCPDNISVKWTTVLSNNKVIFKSEVDIFTRSTCVKTTKIEVKRLTITTKKENIEYFTSAGLFLRHTVYEADSNLKEILYTVNVKGGDNTDIIESFNLKLPLQKTTLFDQNSQKYFFIKKIQHIVKKTPAIQKYLTTVYNNKDITAVKITKSELKVDEFSDAQTDIVFLKKIEFSPFKIETDTQNILKIYQSSTLKITTEPSTVFGKNQVARTVTTGFLYTHNGQDGPLDDQYIFHPDDFTYQTKVRLCSEFSTSYKIGPGLTRFLTRNFNAKGSTLTALNGLTAFNNAHAAIKSMTMQNAAGVVIFQSRDSSFQGTRGIGAQGVGVNLTFEDPDCIAVELFVGSVSSNIKEGLVNFEGVFSYKDYRKAPDPIFVISQTSPGFVETMYFYSYIQNQNQKFQQIDSFSINPPISFIQQSEEGIPAPYEGNSEFLLARIGVSVNSLRPYSYFFEMITNNKKITGTYENSHNSATLKWADEKTTYSSTTEFNFLKDSILRSSFVRRGSIFNPLRDDFRGPIFDKNQTRYWFKNPGIYSNVLKNKISTVKKTTTGSNSFTGATDEVFYYIPNYSTNFMNYFNLGDALAKGAPSFFVLSSLSSKVINLLVNIQNTQKARYL